MNKFIKIISAVSVIALSAALCGCADSGSSSENKVVMYDDSNSYENPNDKLAETKPPAEKTEGVMGTETAFKDCKINLVKVMNIGEDDENTSYCAAIFEISNSGTEPLEVSSLGDFIIQPDGEEEVKGLSAMGSTIASYALPDMQIFSEPIQPGESAEGYIAFPVSQNWESLTISYCPQYNNDNGDCVVYTVTPDMITE